MRARIIGFAIGALLALPLSYWLADRSIPALQGPIEIVKVTKDYLVFRQSIIRKRSCSVQIVRSFIDKNGNTWQSEVDFYVTNGMPGEDRWGQTVALPASLPAGETTFRIQKIWVCNPLQHIWPIEWHGEATFEAPARSALIMRQLPLLAIARAASPGRSDFAGPKPSGSLAISSSIFPPMPAGTSSISPITLSSTRVIALRKASGEAPN